MTMSVKTNTNNISILQQEPSCQTMVHKNVCVQGTVTITPSVTTGEVTSFCIGNPLIGSCAGEMRENYEFTVSQKVCVQIPLTFSATASAVEDGIVGNGADLGQCTGTGCTQVVSFYRDNPITIGLIENAGGSIVLGINGNGLSLSVTTANVNDVLNFNAPSPPTPASFPLDQQYRFLYAQLLAANLNVLALEDLGVEICTYAIEAIAAANDFLATSPPEGKAGALEHRDDLARFNSGNAPGCPFLCD
jgi:hypothetical protein